MLKVLYFAMITLLISTTTTITAQRNCQTMDNLQLKSLFYPEIHRRMQEIERHTSNHLPIVEFRSDQKIIIPVVVHIVYANGNENLTLERIKSQIDVLNEDFNRRNADRNDLWPQAASINIEFRLAELDPQGKPTTGVIRKFTSRSYFSTKDQVKYDGYGGSDAWPSTDYLNIWVCDLYKSQMGFAQFPGAGPASSDGVVVDYVYFGRTDSGGRYSLGRTCTHEVGHWLNLRHIWGDGDCKKDDYVDDTPSASYPTFGCQPDKNSCTADEERDMIENFMDYTNDGCMNLFTEGQKARMRTLFMPGGFRESLLTSKGLTRNNNKNNSDTEEEVENNSSNPNEGGTQPNVEEEEPNTPPSGCPAPTNLSATVSGNGLIASWSGSSEKYIFQIKLPQLDQWFGFTLTKNDIRIAGLSKGVDYSARIKSVCDDDSESEWIDFTLSLDRFTGEVMAFAQNNILASPNPATEALFVEWSLPDYQIDLKSLRPSVEVKPVTRVKLYNVLGQQVIDMKIDKGMTVTRLDVSDLNSGLYILVLFDEDEHPVGTKKIAVK